MCCLYLFAWRDSFAILISFIHFQDYKLGITSILLTLPFLLLWHNIFTSFSELCNISCFPILFFLVNLFCSRIKLVFLSCHVCFLLRTLTCTFNKAMLIARQVRAVFKVYDAYKNDWWRWGLTCLQCKFSKNDFNLVVRKVFKSLKLV